MPSLTPSNVTDDTIAEYAAEALAAKRELELAQQEARSKNGSYRGILKRAKKAGVDQAALIRVINERLLDPVEVVKAEQNYIRYKAVAGGWPKFQDELFQGIAPVDADAQRKMVLERVYDDGLFTGQEGHERDRNTHTLGTEEHQTWDRGWLMGRDQRKAAGKAGEAPPAKPRRDRPGKKAPVEAEAVPA